METFQPKLILCPTDFSDLATLALRYAARFAEAWDARLLVLYANQFLPPPYFTHGQAEELAKSLEHSKQAARSHLDDYVVEHTSNQLRTASLVVEDLPVPAILKTAEAREADLIVMGTHGRGGLSHLLLGSVTERVLRETDRPVLTVRQKAGAQEPVLKRILCPVNFTAVARQALEHAVVLAQTFNAELSVLNVIETDGDERELDELCGWIPADVRAQCKLNKLTRRGDAPSEIIALAEAADSDLIVLGAQHKSFRDTTVIGTTTARVVRHAPCPVLTVIRPTAE